ncbi:MAG: nitroreductase family protein [Alphaproteobacteria bacterium]|nr:nitroreductase family protein [Alphaproteobacteria bacterium]
MTQSNSRNADFNIEPLFLDRWSPRAFTGEAIDLESLKTLFEAARWAPSAFNSQPWRILYAQRDSAAWSTLLDLLIEFNQSWAKDAGALAFFVSDPNFRRPGSDTDTVSGSASFDTGAAWASLALQATAMSLSVHGMTGFDMEKARTALNVPSHCKIEAAVAIGRKGDAKQLPEGLAAMESPNNRKAQSTFTFEGGFPTK